MKIFLRLLEHEIHSASLLFLVIVYILRIVWIFRFKFKMEQTYPGGNKVRPVTNSVLAFARPWGIGYKNNRVFYLQFIVFHLGVAAVISATFIIPYKPAIMINKNVIHIYQILLGSALAVGLFRFFRRIFNPALRYISTPDDYFSIILMMLFFSVGIIAISYQMYVYEHLVFFFLIANFLHLYVPFSKIIHYLYYPFMRYYLGMTFGHRNTGNDKV